MPIILNKEKLATNELRRQALEILEAGLEAIDTEKILRNKIKLEGENLEIDGNLLKLTDYKKIFFVGIGKCALDGARVIEEILGNFLTEGIVIDVRDPSESKLNKIKYRQGTHPLPSEQNVEATKEILNMVRDLNKNDLVITLISGGGSSLFEFPKSKFSLDDIIEKTKELTAKGADIYELNEARKEMSQVKGGKFAKIIAPAQTVSLIFSDVLGNDISIIASGPTVIDSSFLPSPNLGEGDAIARGEDKVKNILLVSNHDALEAMKIKAKELDFGATIETESFSGNAAEKGKELALREPKFKSCIIFGGETTVRIPQNHGIGGRNQEMALSALLYIHPNSILICASSDGWDNTDHAGALVDAELLEKAKSLNLVPEEFLMHGDSYNFFKKIEDGAIYTGKLGSNVSDLYIILYK